MTNKAMTITYPVYDGIYVNMTNRCDCACTFCLRQNRDAVYGSDPLWLEREPSVEEVIDSLKQWDLNKKEEVVFCGFGEPTMRLFDLLEVARWIKQNYTVPIRINTNGLADLQWQQNTAPLLAGLIDCVSISLNATDAETYNSLCRPAFGIVSYDALKAFTRECTKYVPDVVLTVVDQVTTPEQQKRSAEIAQELGARLRIRPYED